MVVDIKERNKEIKKLCKKGRIKVKLAKRFNISATTLHCIVTGRKPLTPKKKNEIRESYSHKCAACEKQSGIMHIHHRDFDPGNIKLKNLVLLCESCHKNIHKREKTIEFIIYITRYYRAGKITEEKYKQLIYDQTKTIRKSSA